MLRVSLIHPIWSYSILGNRSTMLVTDDPEDRVGRHDEYLRTAEVARLLHVSTKTISRWAHENRLPFVLTLGGHRRFPAKAVLELAARLTKRPS